MISYHFLNQTSRGNFFTNDSAHGAGQLWSKIPQIPSYGNHLVPFPIAVADSRPVGFNSTAILPLDSVVYEVSSLLTLLIPILNTLARYLRWRLHLSTRFSQVE